MNWFTLAGRDTRTPLRKDDWFITVEIVADSGFDTDKMSKSQSFLGPDPKTMPPIEKTVSELYLRLYQFTGDTAKEWKPGDVTAADEDDVINHGQWQDIPDAHANGVFWTEPLADLFSGGGTANLIKRVRTALKERNMIAAEG